GGVRPGIRVDAGNNTAGENSGVCVDISGNVSAGSGGTNGIGLRKQGTNPSGDAFGIVGMKRATARPDVGKLVNGQNPAGNGTLLISATSGFSNCSFSPLASNGSRANGTITLARVLPTQGTHGDLALTRLLRGARAVADATEGAVADARRNVRANYTSIFARAVVLQQTLSTAIQSVGRSAAGALVTPLQAFTASVDADLGTLAGGKSITVVYDVTVDPPPVATYG